MTEEWRTYVRLTCAATFASWIDMAVVRDEFYEWQNVWNQNISIFTADEVMVFEILGVIISLSSCSMTLNRKDGRPTVRTVL